jgi:hypothetical protein
MIKEEILNQQEDEDAYRSNQLDPAPDEINTNTGKCMWIIKEYRIWATSYQEALKHLQIIENI